MYLKLILFWGFFAIFSDLKFGREKSDVHHSEERQTVTC